MVFVNPSYLWAFIGLSIPLAIHLWNNRKGTVIKVGSTAFLKETDSAQSNSINLNEYWLLFLRMLTVALLVLIMAEPRLPFTQNNVAITYLVEKSVLTDAAVKRIIADLPKAYDLRLLETGFPEIDRNQMDQITTLGVASPNYWQLMEEMKSLNSDSLVIFTNAYQSGLKGKRPETDLNVAWIVIEPYDFRTALKAINESDNIEVLFAENNPNKLSYTKEYYKSTNNALEFNAEGDSLRLNKVEKAHWVPIVEPKEYHVLIHYDDKYSDQVHYLEASFNSISKFLSRSIKVEKQRELERSGSRYIDLLIELKDSIEDSELKDTKTLRYRPDGYSNELITKSNERDEYILTELLNSENILQQHISEHLMDIMDLEGDINQAIKNSDSRTIAVEELKPNITKGKEYKSTLGQTNILPWILIMLGLTILAERILARQRKQ